MSFGWAYNRDIEPGHFDIERWNYTNSICFISGCYAIKSYPFSTYVISGTACTGKYKKIEGMGIYNRGVDTLFPSSTPYSPHNNMKIYHFAVTQWNPSPEMKAPLYYGHLNVNKLVYNINRTSSPEMKPSL